LTTYIKPTDLTINPGQQYRIMLSGKKESMIFFVIFRVWIEYSKSKYT